MRKNTLLIVITATALLITLAVGMRALLIEPKNEGVVQFHKELSLDKSINGSMVEVWGSVQNGVTNVTNYTVLWRVNNTNGSWSGFCAERRKHSDNPKRWGITGIPDPSTIEIHNGLDNNPVRVLFDANAGVGRLIGDYVVRGVDGKDHPDPNVSTLVAEVESLVFLCLREGRDVPDKN